MWLQQDQLLLRTLITSLSTEVLSLIIGCTTSHIMGTTLASTSVFSSTTCIMFMQSASIVDLERVGSDQMIPITI